MQGTRILVTSKPRGVFEDVYIAVGRTPKPGVCMEIDPTVAHVGGVFTYQEYGVMAASSGQYITADGNRKAIAILLEKDQENKIYSDSYVAGDLGRIYWPVMGEQFNMLFEDVGGTADDFIIGEEVMVDDGTGMLLTATSSVEAHPFTVLEVVADPVADHWTWCRFNGAGGA